MCYVEKRIKYFFLEDILIFIEINYKLIIQIFRFILNNDNDCNNNEKINIRKIIMKVK
jgi:hypothetical protein